MLSCDFTGHEGNSYSVKSVSEDAERRIKICQDAVLVPPLLLVLVCRTRSYAKFPMWNVTEMQNLRSNSRSTGRKKRRN